MRYTLLLSALLFVSVCDAQQEQEPTPNAGFKERVPNRELGVFLQTTFSPTDGEDLTLMGLQYKKWKSEHLGYRLMVSYGDYNHTGVPFFIGASKDTAVEKFTDTHISLAVIGGGIEAQRRLYKRVYMFAALELRGGYGTGTIDTATVKRLVNNSAGDYYSYEGSNRGDVNMFYLGFAPTVGAKLLFKHFTVGVELLGIQASFKSINPEHGAGTSTMDLNVGNIAHRVFFSYLF